MNARKPSDIFYLPVLLADAGDIALLRASVIRGSGGETSVFASCWATQRQPSRPTNPSRPKLVAPSRGASPLGRAPSGDPGERLNTPLGVRWTSRRSATIPKPAPMISLSSFELYRATGRPEHRSGPPGARWP
jgi:hypothetical protein